MIALPSRSFNTVNRKQKFAGDPSYALMPPSKYFILALE